MSMSTQHAQYVYAYQYLAYLKWMLEKTREFTIRAFPGGLVLSWDCPNLLNDIHILKSLL